MTKTQKPLTQIFDPSNSAVGVTLGVLSSLGLRRLTEVRLETSTVAVYEALITDVGLRGMIYEDSSFSTLGGLLSVFVLHLSNGSSITLRVNLEDFVTYQCQSLPRPTHQSVCVTTDYSDISPYGASTSVRKDTRHMFSSIHEAYTSLDTITDPSSAHIIVDFASVFELFGFMLGLICDLGMEGTSAPTRLNGQEAIGALRRTASTSSGSLVSDGRVSILDYREMVTVESLSYYSDYRDVSHCNDIESIAKELHEKRSYTSINPWSGAPHYHVTAMGMAGAATAMSNKRRDGVTAGKRKLEIHLNSSIPSVSYNLTGVHQLREVTKMLDQNQELSTYYLAQLMFESAKSAFFLYTRRYVPSVKFIRYDDWDSAMQKKKAEAPYELTLQPVQEDYNNPDTVTNVTLRDFQAGGFVFYPRCPTYIRKATSDVNTLKVRVKNAAQMALFFLEALEDSFFYREFITHKEVLVMRDRSDCVTGYNSFVTQENVPPHEVLRKVLRSGIITKIIWEQR